LDAFDRVTDAANAPVYSWITTVRDRGAVGGSLVSPELLATRLAELTLRVLGGEKPDDIPVVEVDGNVDEVDWRQLRRWGISESRVPAGTNVRFRQPSLWAQYKFYIVATTSLLVLQTALIAGLVVQRVRRRRAESALRESEERFRIMADTAPVMEVRHRQRCDFFNKPWLEFRGRTMAQETVRLTEGVHPADPDDCLIAYTAAFDERRPFRHEPPATSGRVSMGVGVRIPASHPTATSRVTSVPVLISPSANWPRPSCAKARRRFERAMSGIRISPAV
jgi:PAS domain-containing protein